MRVQAYSKKARQARADRRGNQGTQALGKCGTGQTGYDHPSVQYRRVWHPCAGDRSSGTEIWEVICEESIPLCVILSGAIISQRAAKCCEVEPDQRRARAARDLETVYSM